MKIDKKSGFVSMEGIIFTLALVLIGTIFLSLIINAHRRSRNQISTTVQTTQPLPVSDSEKAQQEMTSDNYTGSRMAFIHLNFKGTPSENWYLIVVRYQAYAKLNSTFEVVPVQIEHSDLLHNNGSVESATAGIWVYLKPKANAVGTNSPPVSAVEK